LIRT